MKLRLPVLRYLPIVYVEDQENDFACLRDALVQTKQEGPLIHLSNGIEAEAYFRRAKAEQFRIGLIVIDLRLPGKPGVDLIKSIRSEPFFNKVPVIAISGHYVYDELDGAYATGANLFMIKPSDAAGWSQMVFRLREYFSPSE